MATSTPAGTNINWLALTNPQIASQQLQIQRQNQIAQQLMDQGSQQQDPAQLANPGGLVVPVSPWAAAAKALEKGVGGYVQGQADAKQNSMYQQMAASMQAQNPATNPQNGAPLPWSGSMTPDNTQAAQQALGQALQAKAQMQGGQMQGGKSFTPGDGSVTGTPMGDISFLQSDPGAYFKAAADRNQMTPGQKDAVFANNGNSAAAANAMSAELRAKGIHEDRAGSASTDLNTGVKTFNPIVPSGAAPQYGANGQATGIAPLPIVAPGQQPPAPLPQAGITPAPDPQVSQQGQGGPVVLSSDAPPPGGGAPANMDQLLDSVTANSNPSPAQVNAPASGGAPLTPPATAPQTVATQSAAPVLPADFPKPASPSQMTITPADTAAATDNAKAVIQRNNDIIQQANSSPTRLSDLHKINDIAQSPTKFGPGADKVSYWKAVASQLPGINSVGTLNTDGSAASDAANYEIAKKYFSNLSGQYQKALGGTGTDKQLDIAMSGTPGPDMLNQAIAKVAPFLMGQEKALQAQANMRRAVTDPSGPYGGNPVQNLQNAEGYWQKNYDPDAFELASISPAQRAAYIQSLSPADAAKLGGDGKGNKGSYQKAVEAGWIQ